LNVYLVGLLNFFSISGDSNECHLGAVVFNKYNLNVFAGQ